jgi:colanic acid/amylovoran biosynthesis glycosyltransferase
VPNPERHSCISALMVAGGSWQNGVLAAARPMKPPAKLAIAAFSFSEPSETFIRDHVRTLAPGKTILLGRPGTGAAAFGCPALQLDTAPPARRLLGRVASAIRSRARFSSLLERPRRLSDVDRGRVVAFLREHQPIALLAEFGPVGAQFADAAQVAGVPLFVYFHGYDAIVLSEYKRFRVAYRELFAVSKAIVVTTDFMQRQLLELGCPATKLFVCPCGVATDRFAPRERRGHDKRVLMVCRLIERKGPLLALQSFAKVLATHPDATLEIIGDGRLREATQARAKSLGIADRVKFHGPQPHSFVLERLNAADLLVQHCVTTSGEGAEAFGLSIVEAMACEVPVVATRHGGIVETVQDGVTGRLVEERDIEGMASAVAEILDDPERAAAMGAAGRARVLEHFSQEKACERLRVIMGLGSTSPAGRPTVVAPGA